MINIDPVLVFVDDTQARNDALKGCAYPVALNVGAGKLVLKNLKEIERFIPMDIPVGDRGFTPAQALSFQKLGSYLDPKTTTLPDLYGSMLEAEPLRKTIDESGEEVYWVNGTRESFADVLEVLAGRPFVTCSQRPWTLIDVISGLGLNSPPLIMIDPEKRLDPYSVDNGDFRMCLEMQKWRDTPHSIGWIGADEGSPLKFSRLGMYSYYDKRLMRDIDCLGSQTCKGWIGDHINRSDVHKADLKWMSSQVADPLINVNCSILKPFGVDPLTAIDRPELDMLAELGGTWLKGQEAVLDLIARHPMTSLMHGWDAPSQEEINARRRPRPGDFNGGFSQTFLESLLLKASDLWKDGLGVTVGDSRLLGHVCGVDLQAPDVEGRTARMIGEIARSLNGH